MTDAELKLEIRKLKAKGIIKSYSSIAEELMFKPKTLSYWLNGDSQTASWRHDIIEKWVLDKQGAE